MGDLGDICVYMDKSERFVRESYTYIYKGEGEIAWKVIKKNDKKKKR